MSDKKYILALDQGTTSSRAMIFDEKGAVCGQGQQEFPQYFPQSGWVEHDAEEIWFSQLNSIKVALRQSQLKMTQICAVGITNQRETVVVWNRRSGKPLHRAIVWQDRRTAAAMLKLRETGQEEQVRAKTGLLLDPYFSASKLKWILDEVPEARRQAAAGELAAGTIDSWLIYKLTGGKEHITDMTNACRTLLFDIHKCRWDEELLNFFDVPAAVLPRIVPSSGDLAQTSKEVLGAKMVIAGIAGDQHAALCGQLCTNVGMVKNTYGTGCFMLMLTGDKPVLSENRLLTTLAWKLPDQPPQYALEGSVFIGGAAIQWLRDGLELIESTEKINELAAPDNGGVYLVPAFVGLGAPHWDPHARGMLIGITRGTTAGHIARATLESIAFQSMELALAMQQDCGCHFNEMRADGGATASRILMQIQADLLGVPVKVPQVAETTALGAAYFAGLAQGVWKSFEDIAVHWRLAHEYEPAIDEARRAELLHHWQRAVGRARNWIE